MDTKDKKKKFINIRPVLFTAVSLIIGIVFAYYLLLNKTISYILLGVLLFVLVFSIIYYRKTTEFIRIIKCTIYMIIAFIVGLSSFTFVLNRYEKAGIKEDYYVIYGTVSKLSSYDDYFYYVLDDLVLFEDGKMVENRYNLSFYSSEVLELGDQISLKAYVNNYEFIYNGNFSTNKIQKNIKYYTYDVQNLVVYGNDANLFQKANTLIRKTLKENLSEDTFGVALALMTGDSTFIEDNLLTNYRNSGISHIFAVSGLHIGFLSTIICFILNKLRVRKIIQFFIVFPILIFYSGICSFMPSSLRAVIMCSVALLMRCVGEKYDVITSISFSAIIVLLIRPLELFSVGFQLSYVSCIGITLLTRPFTKLLKFLPQKIASNVATILSAQISTAPLLLIYFNKVSIIATLFNLLLVPVVFILFILLFFAIILAIIFPSLGFIFVPMNFMILGINWLVNLFDYSFLLLTGITIGAFVFIYYFVLLIISGFFNFERLSKIILSISLTIVLVVGSTGLTLLDRTTVGVNVSSSGGIEYTLFTGKEDNLVINKIDDSYNLKEITRKLNECEIDKIENVIIATDDTFILFLLDLEKEVSIQNVYYYGCKNSFFTSVMPNVNFINCTVYENATLDAKFSFLADGFAVDYESRGTTFLLVSEMVGTNVFISLKEKRDVVILSDGVESIFPNFVNKYLISYKNQENILNVANGKNILLKINKYGLK